MVAGSASGCRRDKVGENRVSRISARRLFRLLAKASDEDGALTKTRRTARLDTGKQGDGGSCHKRGRGKK